MGQVNRVQLLCDVYSRFQTLYVTLISSDDSCSFYFQVIRLENFCFSLSELSPYDFLIFFFVPIKVYRVTEQRWKQFLQIEKSVKSQKTAIQAKSILEHFLVNTGYMGYGRPMKLRLRNHHLLISNYLFG